LSRQFRDEASLTWATQDEVQGSTSASKETGKAGTRDKPLTFAKDRGKSTGDEKDRRLATKLIVIKDRGKGDDGDR